MSIVVIATSTSGKHRVPLRDVIAFQADEKYVLVHTAANKTLFLSTLIETKSGLGGCPHCGAHTTTIEQFPRDMHNRPLASLAGIEQFIQGRNLPLLRIHRNCIINTTAVAGKNQVGTQRYVVTNGGDFAISRRYVAVVNRTLFRKRGAGMEAAV